MKKLFYAIGCLCLTLSVISCSADDFIENLHANETQEEAIALPPVPLENGDEKKGDKGNKD